MKRAREEGRKRKEKNNMYVCMYFCNDSSNCTQSKKAREGKGERGGKGRPLMHRL